MRSTLPIRLSSCCGCIHSSEWMPRPAGIDELMSRVPSWLCARRPAMPSALSSTFRPSSLLSSAESFALATISSARGARQLRPVRAFGQRGVREIERPVRRERPVGLDFEQALRSADEDLRQPVERLGDFAVLADDLDAATALADDDAAVGEEVEGERTGQAFGKRLDGERLGLCRHRRVGLTEPLRNRLIAVRRRAFSCRRLPRRLRGRPRNSFRLRGHHDSADRDTGRAGDEKSSNHYRFTGLPNTSIFATLT